MKKLTYTALSIFLLGQGSAMAQCPPGQILLRDVFGGGPHCFQPCKTTQECPKDRYCSPNGNVCRLQCNKDSDCPTGGKCNKETRGHFKCEAPQVPSTPVEVNAPNSPEVQALESEPAANVGEKQVETVIEAVEQDAKTLANYEKETKRTNPTLEELNTKIDKLIKLVKKLQKKMKTAQEKEAAAKAAIAAAEAVKAAAATVNNEKDAAALEKEADQAASDAEAAAETAGEASGGVATVITCPPNVFKGSTGAKEFTENNVVFKVMQGKNYSFSGTNALPFSSSSVTRGGNGYAMRCFYQVKGMNEMVTVSASGINYKSCGFENGTEKICTGGQPSDCKLKCTNPGSYGHD